MILSLHSLFMNMFGAREACAQVWSCSTTRLQPVGTSRTPATLRINTFRWPSKHLAPATSRAIHTKVPMVLARRRLVVPTTAYHGAL